MKPGTRVAGRYFGTAFTGVVQAPDLPGFYRITTEPFVHDGTLRTVIYYPRSTAPASAAVFELELRAVAQ